MYGLLFAMLSPAQAGDIVSMSDSWGTPITFNEVKCPHGDGKHLSSYTGGEKHEKGTCSNGVAVGTWTTWHGSGEKNWKSTLEAGRFHGEWMSWYSNGEKRAKGDFVKGIKQGHADGLMMSMPIFRIVMGNNDIRFDRAYLWPPVYGNPVRPRLFLSPVGIIPRGLARRLYV